ncbi:ATP-binding protein [Candidatus Omnitrophota bacterium]
MINNIQLNPFTTSNLLIIAICFTLMLILIKFGKTKLHRIWIFFNLAVFVWGLGAFLMATADNKEIAKLYWKFAITGATFIPILFYHTASIFCEIYKRKVIILAYFQGIIYCFLFFSLFSERFIGIDYLFNSFYYPVWVQKIDGILFGMLYVSIWLFFVIFGHFELFKLHKKTFLQKRNQILYFFIGMIIGFSGGSLNFLTAFKTNFYPYGNFLIPIYCLIVSYAILRHHLMDINIAIKKSLVYSILVAIITAGYLIFVIGVGKLFQGLVGYQSFIVNLMAVFAIALIFNPLRDRIQHFLDRQFFEGTLESLEQERERLRDQLFQAEKLAYVGKLASSIVHEIKNPLTAIKTYVQYLPEKYQDKDFREKFQGLIPQEIERINKVVNQLLDLAKPKEPALRPVNIIDTIDATLALLDESLKLKTINVKKDYESNEVVVKGDEEQLRQVFLNLFLNSIQAMDEAGTLEIAVNLRLSTSKSATICVKDTGGGISEENLQKLFTPFFTTKKDGIGLGLIIAQGIIKNHGGSITVNSKINQGVQFCIELQLVI